MESVLSLRLTDTAMTLREQVQQAYEEHRRAIYRYLLMLGIAPQQAEELCRECFMRLFNVLRKEEKVKLEVAQNARLDFISSGGSRTLPSIALGESAR